MFERLGGEQARATAAAFWDDPNDANSEAYRRICGPLYTQSPGNVLMSVEMIRTPDLLAHWNAGEQKTFDFREDLARARCPVLVMGGELDPVCPIAGSEEIASCLPKGLVQFERFTHSGHGVFRDESERAMRVLRDFVTS
jgi:proline iminopeptidase